MEDRKMKWFRTWHGAPTDRKWIMIAKRAEMPVGKVVSVVWALYDYASQNDDRGSIKGFPAEEIAAFFDYDHQDVVEIIDALVQCRVVGDDHRIIAWDKWQPKREDDTAAERQRRKRDKDRAERDTNNCHSKSRSVTPDVTPVSRDVTPPEIELELEEEVLTKTSSKKLDRSPRGEPSPSISELKADFDEWYRVFPRHAGVGGARAKYLAKRKEGFSKETLLEGARAAAKYYAEEDKRYIPMPATWLNQERWADDYTGPPPKAEQRQRGFREEVDFFEGAI
jgi:hypothetical protein